MDVRHRSSFGCHVANSDVAPGSRVREVSGGGRWASHLGSLSSGSVRACWPSFVGRGGLFCVLRRWVWCDLCCDVHRCHRGVWWWLGWSNNGCGWLWVVEVTLAGGGRGWSRRWWWLGNKSFVCRGVCFCCFRQTPLTRLSIKGEQSLSNIS